MLGGCGILEPYRMEIQQGNALPEDAVQRVSLGMTEEQVRFLLGEPLLTDPFRSGRWDYVFYRMPDKRAERRTRRLTVHFEAGRVSRIEDVPAPPPG
jgi:outer membrane protein assembly factor BamE